MQVPGRNRRERLGSDRKEGEEEEEEGEKEEGEKRRRKEVWQFLSCHWAKDTGYRE